MAQEYGESRAAGCLARGRGLSMTDRPRLRAYAGWSASEVAADRALAASIRALTQADGLLNPALDPIFERHVKAQRPPPLKGPRRGRESPA